MVTKAPAWPADRVERRPLSSLIAYANNARSHSEEQIAQIASSIDEWGWTIPVLVDEAGEIIAGHGRVLAARELRIEEVPVIIARGWSDAQKRAYRIADNKLTLNGEWDEALLAGELADLQALDFSLDLTGFDPEELDSILVVPAVAEADPPEHFATYNESIETAHQCPKCGYRWSGKSGGDE